MKKLALLIIVGLLSWGANFVQAQGNGEEIKRIDTYLTQNAEADRLIGSVLVAHQNQVLYKKGFGKANYTWNIDNTPQTKFKIASISKQFTALLILQLVEAGQLKLTDNISKHLPDYPDDKGNKITIHHLLSHTSGISHYFPEFYNSYSRNFYTPKEYLKVFQDKDLLFEPGSNYRYSSFGYVLLGVILEKITGKSYQTLLQEKICSPLGMKNTGIDDGNTIILNEATGYVNTATLSKAPFRDMSTVFATGQIYSTVEDLNIWLNALKTDKLLTKPYRKLLFQPNIDNYGYGWVIDSFDIHKDQPTSVVYHTGGFNGFNAIDLMDVDSGYNIIILGNAEPTDVVTMAKDILKILYNESPSVPKKSIAKVVGEKIDEEGIAAGLEYYRYLKLDKTDKYSFNEVELINLSDYYWMFKKWDTVIKLLEFNVKEYPESSWSYSNLAGAYVQIGNKELAIKYYKKTLELYPDDSFAKSYLEQMTNTHN